MNLVTYPSLGTVVMKSEINVFTKIKPRLVSFDRHKLKAVK